MSRLLCGLVCGWLCLANAWAAQVVVILSDADMAYQRVADSFTSAWPHSTQVFNLQGDIEQAQRLVQPVLQYRPELIFAVGAKAAFAAKIISQQRKIPVIFSMVLNWQRYGFYQQENMAGITTDVAPGTQFLNMTVFSPQIKRIGVIFSAEHSTVTIEQAKKEAAQLGLELVTALVRRDKDFIHAYRQIAPSIDAFWVVADPVIYTLNNIHWLQRQCVRDRLLCIGQSENATKLGLVLSINPDLAGIGSQAAGLAEAIVLHHQAPSQIGVKTPLSTQISLNMAAAKNIGLEINPLALAMCTEIIGQ